MGISKRELNDAELEQRFGFSIDELLANGDCLIQVKCGSMSEAMMKLSEYFRIRENRVEIKKLNLICDYDPEYPALVIRAQGLPD